MKKYISITVLFIAFLSCKKQAEHLAPTRPIVPSGYLSNVRSYLKTNLYSSDFTSVDTTNTVLSVQDAGLFLRIGLFNKDLSSDFILVQTDITGNCSSGKFVHCRHDTTPIVIPPDAPRIIKAIITVESLKHESFLKKIITNGVITSECAGSQNEESLSVDGGCDVVPSCSDCLPEVVVIGYLPTGGGGISYSDYLNLSNLVNGYSSSSSGPYGGGTVAGIYSPVVIPAYPAAPKPPVRPSPDVIINYEQSNAKPAIDVAAFMKCFAAIPDAGATCSVTILDDLPVNDNPSYIFNILNGATGHCFLQLTKTNGAQSVTQIVGFTTAKPLAMLGIPVAGKIVDNTAHKYNASLTMPLTPQVITMQTTMGILPTITILTQILLIQAR